MRRGGEGKGKERERGATPRAKEKPSALAPDTCSPVFFHSPSEGVLPSPESRASPDHSAPEMGI